MNCACSILSSHVLSRVLEEGDRADREAAARTLAASASFRARRTLVPQLMRQLNVGLSELAFLAPPAGEELTVYDVGHGGAADLPGRRVRGTGDQEASDDSVNEAYTGAETTYRLYKEAFGRESIDGEGMGIVSSVHYGTGFDNAMWNGTQMVYGDGSGRLFVEGGLTKAIDVIGHELTHGVTQYTAGLLYRKQSGALNESFSDVFGSIVKQFHLGQTVDEADWLIGAGILGPSLEGEALRSMKAPGTAFQYDEQPAHMRDYADLPDDNDPRHDNGGVHLNSGIPNKAFYLAATGIGGRSWEKPGQIWYAALTKHLDAEADFSTAAQATITAAGELFGDGDEQNAAREAWRQVGVL